MRDYTLAHVSDAVLLRQLADLVSRDHAATANLLAHMAEVDSRRLYLPRGHSSMFTYCVQELHLSEDAAYKRIQAARAARQFTLLFSAVAEGKVHLAAVCMLAPHLTAENVEDLVEAATHRKKSEIEVLLARRFPVSGARSGMTATIRAIPQLAPGQAGDVSHNQAERDGGLLFAEPALGSKGEVSASCHTPARDEAADQTERPAGPAEISVPHSQLAPGQPQRSDPAASPSRPEIPASPERYLVRVPISKKTHDKLRRAQALLSHSVPSGDVAQVLDRALDALISQLERRKAALVSRPRRAESRRRSSSERARFETPSQATPNRTEAPRPRHIPAHVRRAVWQRDLGQCTFVSPSDHRCTARRFLEYDHIEPVARGGRATVAGMRLRCRAHNQYEAERIFGAEFMTRKRNAARLDMDVTRSAERPGAAATRQTR